MSNSHKPIRKETDIYCPLWKRPVCKVCHTCEWYGLLRGKDPQSEKEIDDWGCAIGFMPKLMVEVAQMERQTGASADKVATEVDRLRQGVVTAAHKIAGSARPSRPKLINADDENDL